MQTAHEFFIHELNEMLDAENQILDALDEQAKESDRPELKRAFEQHRAQTVKQIERLQQCLDDIGEQPQTKQCAGIRGIIEEHTSFKAEDPSDDILDIFNVGAATKVERYEISAYESMIRFGQLMKHRKAVQLLNQNLRDEQQRLKKAEGFSKKLKPRELGMPEEQEEVEAEEQPTRSRSRGRGRRRAA